jgi:hypothetical protein
MAVRDYFYNLSAGTFKEEALTCSVAISGMKSVSPVGIKCTGHVERIFFDTYKLSCHYRS